MIPTTMGVALSPPIRRQCPPFPLAPSETEGALHDDSNDKVIGNNDMPLPLKIVGKTTSILVAAVFMGVLAWKRDALMTSFWLGAISNGILSKVLKKIINHERPPELETATMKLKPSDGGMPSSHAMSLGFIGVFTSLCLPWTRWYLLMYTLVSLTYRVKASLHTWEQVAVGLLIGSTNGYAWQQLCTGNNPLGWNLMQLVTDHVLNEDGVLPFPLLAIPVVVGLLVVGSIERRIAQWLPSPPEPETNKKTF